jgi:hypothetical protein
VAIEDDHRENFATAERLGLKTGDIIKSNEDGRRFKVHIHPLYGWLTLNEIRPDGTVNPSYKNEEWRNVEANYEPEA